MSDSLDKQAEQQEEYEFGDPNAMLRVLGPRGEHLATLQQELGVSMGQRGHSVYFRGKQELVRAGVELVKQLEQACRGGRTFSEVDLVRGARILANDPSAKLDDIFNEIIYVSAKKRLITPKGLVQKQYVDAMRTNDLTFSVGPAGTGKTYLAVAIAISELMERRYRRLVLARPAVEAGERLGFLPGDMAEKINPYLRPLYDALDDMLGPDKTQSLIGQGQIEIAPLAFMRGRTLNDSFVILDEAQNTTKDQMKMFLTRMGYSSKVVVTGDVSQVDLPDGVTSGLVHATRILRDIENIAHIEFSEMDVVRHPLVQDIIRAYDGRKREARKNKQEAENADEQ